MTERVALKLALVLESNRTGELVVREVPKGSDSYVVDLMFEDRILVRITDAVVAEEVMSGAAE